MVSDRKYRGRKKCILTHSGLKCVSTHLGGDRETAPLMNSTKSND